MYSEFTDEYQDWLTGDAGTQRKLWFDMSLGELDCPPAAAADVGTPLRQVVRLMNEQGVGCVLAMDGDHMRGIFTERDLLRKVVPEGLDLDLCSLGQVMTPSPETLPSSALLAHALRVMALGGFRHIPVTDSGGRPTRVVSMRRIIELISETFPKEILNAPPARQRASVAPEGA